MSTDPDLVEAQRQGPYNISNRKHVVEEHLKRANTILAEAEKERRDAEANLTKALEKITRAKRMKQEAETELRELQSKGGSKTRRTRARRTTRRR